MYKKYYRVPYPDYEIFMDENPIECQIEVVKIGEDMLVPKEWVKKYESDVINSKIELIKKDLDIYFKTTCIEKYELVNSGKRFNNRYRLTIYPIIPCFDEDYGGELDRDVEKIGLYYDVDVCFDSGIYGK